MKKLISLLLLVSSISHAEVTYLKVGQPAPFTGYLFDAEMEHRVRMLDVDLRLCNGIVELAKQQDQVQNNTIQEAQARLAFYDTELTSTKEELKEAKSSTLWRTVLFVVAGVAAGYGLSTVVAK